VKHTEKTELHTLESLLRGEIAAAETYHQALDGIDLPSLRSIQRDHGDAIRFLTQEIVERGAEPPTSSGAWGVFARATEGAAKLLGDKRALGALRAGEHQGLVDYENAVTNKELGTKCRDHVVETLIPQQRRHVETLDQLIAAH